MAGVCLADGTLDPTFGTGGIVTTNIDPEEGFSRALLMPDGRILALGWGSSSAYAIRYNPDGSLDTTYGNNGRAVMPLAPADAALQSDGKLVFVATLGSDYYVGRLNAEGTIDTTFNDTGYITINFNGYLDTEFATAMKLQSDGKIVVGGMVRRDVDRYDFGVARITTQGTLDTSFGFGGKRVHTLDDPAMRSFMEYFVDLAVLPNDKIVAIAQANLAPQSGNSIRDAYIAFRFNPNGSRDTAFGVNGVAVARLGAERAAARSVAVQSNGKIIIFGDAEPQFNVHHPAVVRLNDNGSMDPTFGVGGKNILARAPFGLLYYMDVAVQADDKIVFTANSVSRLYPNGFPDPTFGNSGRTETPIDERVVSVQPDGKVIVAGRLGDAPTMDYALMRLSGSICTVYCPGTGRTVVFDFDGDGKTDPSVFRAGTWYINTSSSPTSYYAQQWGLPTDKLVPADYDGDRKTDIAVWRLSGAVGTFYIMESATGTFRVEQFGGTNYDPQVVGDWDGDGKADLALYRIATGAGGQNFFQYRPSSQGAGVTIQWGISGDEPLHGDFDGDGRKDAAVYRPSTNVWYILQSSDSQVRYVYSGTPSDKHVSGDFDGDGKTDIAIFSNGLWAVLKSSDGQGLYSWWGLSTDTLVPGDYDGDGKTDFAVWRDGIYYVQQSGNGEPLYRQFGQIGDVPVASVFVR